LLTEDTPSTLETKTEPRAEIDRQGAGLAREEETRPEPAGGRPPSRVRDGSPEPGGERHRRWTRAREAELTPEGGRSMDGEESGVTEVTAAVIEKGGKYLVSRRPRGDEQVWEFPGGTLEEGETLQQCLKREISEELGMDVEVGEELKTVRTSRGGKTLLIHFYACKITAGRPMALGCREFSWLAPKDLLRLPFAHADKEMARQLGDKQD